MKYFLTTIITVIVTYSILTYTYFSAINISIGEKIEFSTKDGLFRFTCIPSKGRDYIMMENEFNNYKLQNNLENNVKIYRTSRKNYFKISKWAQYKILPEWQYPLID